ncbi:transporter, MotA/TolQ/ExbB proton channel family [Teredinibacter turnerae T7901]|uniref:Transporter, MotA/TolQ/ExbB proton channel family n=1 Tax=Teredinibacter turnerae (strain ATCC 39867 / T7901) TaxID=377629 RepID=C5BSH9_TERTT|nr:flagellar motor protein [Teredinibacter turnerae]ACR11161.1 transporter, MotA/TolQ/ExbB proton channel family [Teredinibacter turnerae T7901]
MDLLSVLGVVIGFAALLGGNFIEGGSWGSLANGPAALIVIGGTIGAAMLQTPMAGLKRALSLFKWIFKPPRVQFKQGITRVVGWAKSARRDGLLGLENIAERERDKFCRKGLQLLVDGSEPEVIRHVLETDLIVAEQRDSEAVQFYESMGGYAPTIGIIGAVMGLIHVMQHLSNPAELGPGIAIAFVATIYGVAFANLLLLPIANKLKACIRQQSQYRELLIEGIISIADGENPRAIEMKLSGYLH